jgi:phosphoglycerate kinase
MFVHLWFHQEECGDGKNDKKEKIKAAPEAIAEFRRQLSRLGDLFVFEAFGTAHRPHSSIVGIDIPERVAGLLMQRELNYYAQVRSPVQCAKFANYYFALPKFMRYIMSLFL